MATYDIYSYNDGEDSAPDVTVVLSDDDSEVVDVFGADASIIEDAEKTFAFYKTEGFSAQEALARYAGSYGRVELSGRQDSAEPVEAE